MLYAHKAQVDIKRIMFIAADKDFSNSISKGEFIHILIKMGAHTKFGEDCVRNAVEEAIDTNVTADEFDDAFRRVKGLMKHSA